MLRLLVHFVIGFLIACNDESSPISPPANLVYSDTPLTLERAAVGLSNVPSVEGTLPFTFSIPNDAGFDDGDPTKDFSAIRIINSTGAIIISSGNDLPQGTYTVDVLVINGAGQTLFPNAYTIIITLTAIVDIPGFTYSVSSERSHYYISDSYSLGWTEAKNLCIQAGGHMAVISDQAENDLVLNVLSNDPNKPHGWIGLTDESSEGNFKWVTGEQLVYENWNAGEPNDQNNEDYVAMHGANHSNPGTWVDQPDAVNKYPVILEIE